MSDQPRPGNVDPAELEQHQAVLEAHADEIRRQLDAGVTRAEYQRLYALQCALKRAAGVLSELRADADRL